MITSWLKSRVLPLRFIAPKSPPDKEGGQMISDADAFELLIAECLLLESQDSIRDIIMMARASGFYERIREVARAKYGWIIEINFKDIT
jgi:hypothetical protein